MTRKEMVAKLLWNSGGIFRNPLTWTMGRPTPSKPDWSSIVAINGSPNNYTNEELEKLVAFAEKATARYDLLFSYRRGANLILFEKLGERWLRKRVSWDMGPMFSPTLDEAIQFMADNR